MTHRYMSPNISPQSNSNRRTPSRKVLIAGASGLVGSNILQGLLKDASVAEVHALCRRPLNTRHAKLTIHVVDFRAIPPLPPMDEVYLALGTTIRQAGSRSAFRAVDLEANLAVAQAGLASGARRFGLVSAMAANARSLMFYNRIKAELEESLAALSPEPETLVIARPSFLLGDRDALSQPNRLGEKIGVWLFRLLAPLLPADYRPVEARRVAQALLATVPSTRGKTVWLSGKIQDFK